MNILAANRARLNGNSVVFKGRKPIDSEKENINSPYMPLILLAYHLVNMVFIYTTLELW